MPRRSRRTSCATALRKRGGDLPSRLRREPGKRWIPGHAVWVHDVLAFHGREGDGRLRRLGEAVVGTLTLAAGGTIDVAVGAALGRAAQ